MLPHAQQAKQPHTNRSRAFDNSDARRRWVTVVDILRELGREARRKRAQQHAASQSIADTEAGHNSAPAMPKDVS